MIELEKLIVDGEEVVIDRKNLKFDEDSLTEYLKKEAGWVDNFGGYLARAEKELLISQLYVEKIYNLRFDEFKKEGGSDAKAESRAKTDPDYIEAKEAFIEAKYKVTRIKNHITAWNINHDNAKSLGYSLNKQMEHLNADIRSSAEEHFSNKLEVYENLNDIDKICGSISLEDL